MTAKYMPWDRPVTVWSRRSGDDLWLVERTFAYAYVRDVHGLIEEGDEITSDLNGRVYAWFEKGVDPNG